MTNCWINFEISLQLHWDKNKMKLFKIGMYFPLESKLILKIIFNTF